MNLMILICLAIAGYLFIWLVQSVALWWAGEPLAPPLRSESQTPLVKWSVRTAIQVTWFSILIVFPRTLGESAVAYFGRMFPTDGWQPALTGLLVFFGLIAATFAIEFQAGWLRFEPQHTQRVRRRKLLRRCFTPLLLALVEEGVFRGVLLEQLLQALPAAWWRVPLAIGASSAVFSAVHFARPHSRSKPIARPAFGLFAVGTLFGTAFVVTGHSLWMPIALHAAGIFGTEVLKLYAAYRGPIAMIGYPDFPHCGLIGGSSLVIMLCLLCSGAVG